MSDIVKHSSQTKSTIGLAVKNNEQNMQRLYNVVKQTILECCNIAGVNRSPEDIAWMAGEMCSDIVKNYGNLTSDEVIEAFKSGSKEEYGTYYNGINVRNLNIFLREYSRSHKRERFVADRERKIIEHQINANRKMLSNSGLVSHDELKAIISNAEESYKETGYYNDYNNILYNFILQHDKSIEVNQQDKEQAKSKFVSDVKKKDNVCIHSILDEIEQTGKDPAMIIEIDAKKIAVNRWLENRLYN